MDGRPYVILWEPVHPSASDRSSGLSLMKPPPQPDYVTLGMLLEGQKSVDDWQKHDEPGKGRNVDSRPDEEEPNDG